MEAYLKPVPKPCTKKIYDQLRYIKRKRDQCKIRISYSVGPAERQKKQRHKVGRNRLSDESEITCCLCPVIISGFFHNVCSSPQIPIRSFSKVIVSCSLYHRERSASGGTGGIPSGCGPAVNNPAVFRSRSIRQTSAPFSSH